MARPTKQGIDYFPLDCQFDDKIEMYLMDKEATGLAVLVTLWQLIYSNEGYYIINNEDLHLLIKRRINAHVIDVSDCIEACLRRGIFDNDMNSAHGILTSKAIQKRYFDAAKKKKKVIIIDKYVINGVSASGNSVTACGNATNVNVNVNVNVDVKELKIVTPSVWPIYVSWMIRRYGAKPKNDVATKSKVKMAVVSMTTEEAEGMICCFFSDESYTRNGHSAADLLRDSSKLLVRYRNTSKEKIVYRAADSTDRLRQTESTAPCRQL